MPKFTDHPMPVIADGAKREPDEMIEFADDFYFRSVVLTRGDVVGQHVHDRTHASFVGWGKVRGWKNGECMGDKSRGEAFIVEAGAEHAFQALEDSLIACVYHTAMVGA